MAAAHRGGVPSGACPHRRDGFVESPTADQEKFRQWALQFRAVKQAAEFFERRPRRFRLVDAASLKDAPGKGMKRIHLMRHGEGRHNVWRQSEFNAGRRPHAKRGNFADVPQELHDPYLTDKGRAEAIEARSVAALLEPELLVTSPVRRALQTCLLAFDGAVAAGVQVLAHDLCREQFQGLDPSVYDGRKGRAELEAEFPSVDFGQFVLAEAASTGHGGPGGPLADDALWWDCGSPLGRCEGGVGQAAVIEHAYGFLCWLMSRPEVDIGVATHSIFLFALWYGVLELPEEMLSGDPVLFHTAELRTVVVEEVPQPDPSGTNLAVYREALLGQGLACGDGGKNGGARKRPRTESATRAGVEPEQ